MQDFTNFNPNSHQPGSAIRASVSAEALFFQRIYTWMFAGLGLTAVVAFIAASSQAFIRFYFSSPIIYFGALALEIGLVFYLAARISRLEPNTAKMIFLGYAALNGLNMSILLLVYPSMAFVKAFVCAAGVYGAMAVYGLVTKRSLQGWGSFLIMGLIGLIIAGAINLFVRSAPMDFVICVIGVLIFAGLTAYDHQKLRVIHATGLDGSAAGESRVVIMGALTLYLDFINLFVLLLNLLNSRD